MRPTSTESSYWSTLVFAYLLVALAVLAYWPAMQGGFVWDDGPLIVNNGSVKDALRV